MVELDQAKQERGRKDERRGRRGAEGEARSQSEGGSEDAVYCHAGQGEIAKRTAQQRDRIVGGTEFSRPEVFQRQDLEKRYQRRDLKGFQHLARFGFLRVEALNRLFDLS